MKPKIITTYFGGVILDNNNLSNEHKVSLFDDGYLVLSTGDTIEWEEPNSGKLIEGCIVIPDRYEGFFYLYVIKDNKIKRTIKIPLYHYLLQLDEIGALDCYPKVEFDKYSF